MWECVVLYIYRIKLNEIESYVKIRWLYLDVYLVSFPRKWG